MTTRHIAMLGIALATAPAIAGAATPLVWEEGGARVETVAYACGAETPALEVAYFTAPDGSSFAALAMGGALHALTQVVSGSGVRYADIDAEAGYLIHTKGDTLLLLRQPAGGGEEELLADCTVVEPR